MIADDRGSQIAVDRKESCFHNYNRRRSQIIADNRKADCSHTIQSVEMSNVHMPCWNYKWDRFRLQIAELWFPYDCRIAIIIDRKWSQTIAEDRTWFYLLRLWSQDRRRSQKCVSIWSQTFAELFVICDPRSSAIIWKPALRVKLCLMR